MYLNQDLQNFKMNRIQGFTLKGWITNPTQYFYSENYLIL